MNLILLEPSEVSADGVATLVGERARHLVNVLKVTPGSEVRVGVLDGPQGVGAVTCVGDGTVDLSCSFATMVAPPPCVDLLLALPRPKVLRRLWAQIAALGVGRIILTNAARVERNYFDTHVLTVAGYRPLLIEGLQQARDTHLPVVSIHRQFKVLIEDALDGLFSNGLRLVADPSAPGSPSTLIHERLPERVLLAVGPEGGWNDFEMDLLAAHGFEPVGMGPRTLRTDTAAIALLAIVHHAIDPLDRLP